MIAYIKKLLRYWEVKRQQKEEVDLFLKTYHLKLVKVKETSIILSCIQPVPSGKKNKYNLVRKKDGFVLEKDLTLNEITKKSEEYRNAATKRKIPFEQYLDELIKSKRKNVAVKNLDDIGKVISNGIVKLDLVDDLGNFIGRLTRSSKDKGRTVLYIFQNAKGQKRNIFTSITLLEESIYDLPIKQGEKILYADINIPKNILDEFSGLGKIILDDTLGYFLNNSKFGNVDGIFGVWTRNEEYYKVFGGESVNLTKFWKTMAKSGDNIEESAFSTFTGDWAKNNKFRKIQLDPENPLSKDFVVIKFLK